MRNEPTVVVLGVQLHMNLQRSYANLTPKDLYNRKNDPLNIYYLAILHERLNTLTDRNHKRKETVVCPNELI